jgi:hypothetical protein
MQCLTAETDIQAWEQGYEVHYEEVIPQRRFFAGCCNGFNRLHLFFGNKKELA